MKYKNLTSTFIVVLMGLTAVLLAACGGNPPPAEAQEVLVVTATPQPGWTIEAATPPVVDPTATPLLLKPGSLLQGHGKDIFYLTEAGSRQRFTNWDTLRAFGFSQADIVTVENETLASIPLAGELTRLVRDKVGRLYWVAEGKLWRVDEWETVLSRRDYSGMTVTQLDSSLKKALPGATKFKDGAVLRQGNALYYLYGGAIIPVESAVDDRVEIIEVPDGVLAAYEPKTQIDQIYVALNADTQAANLRQGPGLEYEIVNVIQKSDGLIRVNGHTPDGRWLYVSHEQTEGWLAAHLVQTTVDLSLLAVVDDIEELVPEVSPAQVETVQSSNSLPVYCYDTPIRGFGKVWGDHPEVQTTLGCPSQSREEGTNAAVQHFQHGVMLWLEADTVYSADPVYVLFDDGSYQRFGELGPADPEKIGETPDGFFAIGDKFSKVYWEGTGSRVKERLGYATTAASDSPGAFQQFYNGRMFWLGAVDRIFILYDYYVYDENETYVRTQSWASYEDRF